MGHLGQKYGVIWVKNMGHLGQKYGSFGSNLPFYGSNLPKVGVIWVLGFYISRDPGSPNLRMVMEPKCFVFWR